MSATTMDGGFCPEKAVDREPAAAAPASSVNHEQAKEKTMEKTIAVNSGTPFSERLGAQLRTMLPPVLGLLIVLGIWHVATFKGGSIPGPAQVWQAAVALFSDPFYRNGPNDQGIG